MLFVYQIKPELLKYKYLPKMKTRQLIVLALILMLSGRICQAQGYFVNTYGLDANPFLSIVCTDSCFFSVASNMAGSSSLLAIKTDPAGNILWSRQISITSAPYLLLKDIVQAADGGYLILAYTQIPGIIYSYQSVIKLNQAGNFLWTRSYYSISSNVAYSIIKNNDNGFMFVGGGCNGNNYVFKCGQHGEIIWQKGFTAGSGGAFNIATHDYNHFVVSGYTGTDLLFFEIDVSGNFYWQSVVSIPNQGIGTYSLKPTLDNGYVGTGQVLLNTGVMNQAFIIKINPSGMLSWMKIYKVLNSGSVGNDITETSDSSILMVGFSSTSYFRGLMIKTDKNGNFMFAKGEPYQQSYSEYNSVNWISPGRILLSGQCQNGFLPTFIAVTDDSFSSFCNIAALSVSDSVPLATSSFITNTPVNLSFLIDSLPVTVIPYSLTKNVLCSSTIVPTVTTGSATAVTLNSAILNGIIMPGLETLAGFFEYGNSVSYGSTIPALPDTVAGNYPTSISVGLTSLIPNTVYHYRCLATDGINSYYGNDKVFVTCIATVPIITGNDSLCPNSGYYSYQTQPGFLNYQWAISAGGTITYGEGTPEVQVTWQLSGDRWISVTFMDPGGCTSATPTLFPVYVKFMPNPAGPITGLQTVCAGTEGVYYHTDPIPGACAYVWTLPPGAFITQGQWTNGIMVNFNDSSQSGSFIVNGNNLCGNGPGSPEFPVTVNLKPPDPFITQSGDTLFSDAPADNQWFNLQQPIPGETGTYYVPDVNGDFSVIVTLNGCLSEPSNVIHFILTGNESAGGHLNLIIFPNPSAGIFYLAGQDFSDSRATVYDLAGRKVYNKKVSMNLLDLRELHPGLYFCVLQHSDGTMKIKKLIITR